MKAWSSTRNTEAPIPNFGVTMVMSVLVIIDWEWELDDGLK